MPGLPGPKTRPKPAAPRAPAPCEKDKRDIAEQRRGQETLPDPTDMVGLCISSSLSLGRGYLSARCPLSSELCAYIQFTGEEVGVQGRKTTGRLHEDGEPMEASPGDGNCLPGVDEPEGDCPPSWRHLIQNPGDSSKWLRDMASMALVL